jgi:quinol monooxygenase YgiN
MVTMFVKHTVNNYGSWKSVYDNFASVRKEKGVTGASVYRDPNDSNTIIITHQFKDLNAAKAFAGSEDLKSAMMNAGVSGQPEFWFGESIESTSF